MLTAFAKQSDVHVLSLSLFSYVCAPLSQLPFVSGTPPSVSAVFFPVVLESPMLPVVFGWPSLAAIESDVAPGFPVLFSVADVLPVAVAPRRTCTPTDGQTFFSNLKSLHVHGPLLYRGSPRGRTIYGHTIVNVLDPGGPCVDGRSQ